MLCCRIIQYVNNFNYLGVLIDDQLTFTPYYKTVKRRVENKIFTLSKIRRYVDNRTSLLIYKQAILPLFEYVGFVLTACNIRQRKELEKLQNNALRLCKRYYLLDMVIIDLLHNECRIRRLEQRRRKQLLRLMFLHSNNDDNVKKRARLTRAAGKIIFKTATKCTGKYMNSPFYKGTLFWNDISAVEQYLESVLQFANVLDKIYVLYMRRSLHKMVHLRISR